MFAKLLVSFLALAMFDQAARAADQVLWESKFSDTAYGQTPQGWRDVVGLRPSRSWVVDGNGFLRMTLKSRTGLVAYAGDTLDGNAASALGDALLTAQFKKTEDDEVSFGIAARIVDANNYYLARFAGTDRLELIKVKDGQEVAFEFVKPAIDVASRPTGLVTLNRYREGQKWKLSLLVVGDKLTARVTDEKGTEMARLDAIDTDFAKGEPGLCCTRFASAESFKVEAPAGFDAKTDAASVQKKNAAIAAHAPDYPVVKPYWKVEELNTPRAKIQSKYDIVIAGAGTGGTSAAIQAARLGLRVLLLEETDWIGGQMCSAAVASMDEDGVYGKFPVRERGIYRQFNESMVCYYQTLDKDPFVAYYGYPEQVEGGYEPKAARAVLYALIKDAPANGGAIDVSVRSRVVEVAKDGDTVKGATIEFQDEAGNTRKQVACKILIDATEYGDVVPLTGSRYRAGNATSEKPNLKAPVQDHTWTAVLREYPNGVPEHLQIKSPPPNWEAFGKKRWANYNNDGFLIWGGAGKGIKGHRTWRVYFAWRGMADADSSLTGERSWERHTQCGFNGGNDYPVTAATLDDPAQRLIDEREGVYRSLSALYHFQQILGVNWSLAEDEGFNTEYNRAKMKKLNLPPDLEKIAVYLPQQPYVRESKRMFGIKTLVANDLTRFENAKLFPTSVAMGDYFMDLDHGGTGTAIETDLDTKESPRGGGPFQVPFEVFIPEKIDGFVPAEKNFSQSRIANGATRLQPITMLTGQAAGTIAALAIKANKQPRALDPKQVQKVLLESQCTLIQRWHSDVPWATPIWRATQLLSLYQVLDRPGPITKDRQALAAGYAWGVNEPLKADELAEALARLAELKGAPSGSNGAASAAPVTWAQLKSELAKRDASWAAAIEVVAAPADPNQVRAGEFALVAAKILAP